MPATKKDVAPPVDKTFEERDRLVESCLPMAYREAHRFWRRNKDIADLEDFQQAAIVSTIEAANRFKPSMNLKFVTYVTWCIRGQLIQFFRSQSLMHVSWTMPTQAVRDAISRIVQMPLIDEERPIEFEDPSAVDIFDHLDRQEERDRFHRVLEERLKPRAAAILRARYPHDRLPRTLDDLGQELGIGKERVRQIEADALDVLMKHFGVIIPRRKNKKHKKKRANGRPKRQLQAAGVVGMRA